MIDWVVRCTTHREQLLAVTPTRLKCGSCTHDDDQQPYLEWVAKVSRLALDGAKYYKSCSDQVSKQVWEQVALYQEHTPITKQIKAEKLKLNEQFKLIKASIAIKLDLLHDALLKQIDDHVSKYEEDMALCTRVQQEMLVCQGSTYLQNTNNLHLILQQSTQTQVDDMLAMITQLQTIQFYDKQLAQNLKQASARVLESELVVSNRDSIESLLVKVLDQIQANFSLSKKKPSPIPAPVHHHQSSQQQRPLSPMNKENNYFSHNPTQASGPSGIGTPLSSNRALQKQYSMPTEKSTSKSPRRVTPSPITTRNVEQTMMATNGNKTLLINSDKKGFNPMDMSIKPLKKYQIDFLVAAVEVVTENIFAMSSSVDPYLRIFDTVQKRIHTLQSHLNPILTMDKTHSYNTKIALGAPKPRFLITLSSDSLVVWVFEATQQGGSIQPVPQIQHKVKCQENLRSLCYLQDGQTILQGDMQGTISLYNLVHQRTLLMERQHERAIVNITYQQKQKKVIVFCEDQSISIWRVIFKSTNVDTLLIEVLPFVIQVGSLKTVNVVNSPDHLVVGNSVGQLILLNILTQVVELETQPQQNSIVDMIVAEDATDETTMCAVAICQNLKYLRMWKIQKYEQQFIQSESKVEIAMTLGDNLHQSKLQFVQLYNGSYYVLIANENGKELLVYEVTQKQ